MTLTRPRFRRAAPDGLVACVLLAFLATAGLFYVNLMSALIASLIDGLGFSNREAGFVGSANVYGAAAGALAAVFIVRRIEWRRTEVMLLLLLLSLDLVSTLVRTPQALIALRFLHGLVGGLSVGIGLAVIARTAIPDRAFGMLLTVQFGLGGLGVMFLPGLAQQHGTQVLFLALAAFTAVTLSMIPFLAEYPPRERIVAANGEVTPVRRVPLVLTLVALFLFQLGNMALNAFIIPLGRHYGHPLEFITATIGTATWIGALGSVIVIWSAGRFGRTVPIVIAILLTLVGTAAFLRSDLSACYVFGNVVTSIAWSFLVPYLFGMCAQFDPAGQAASLGGFFSKMGLATGPAAAAFLIGDTGNYVLLIAAAFVGLTVCGLAALRPALLLDRDSEPPPTR